MEYHPQQFIRILDVEIYLKRMRERAFVDFTSFQWPIQSLLLGTFLRFLIFISNTYFVPNFIIFSVDEIRSGSEGVPRARLRLADRRQQPGPAPITTITTNDDDIIESTTPTPQTNNVSTRL